MPFSGPNRRSFKKILVLGNFLLTDSLKLSMNLKACSHEGAVENFFFLPVVRSFMRELGESILATPSEFSVNALFIRKNVRERKGGQLARSWNVGLDKQTWFDPKKRKSERRN